MFGSLIKMFLFEKNRNEKIKMIKGTFGCEEKAFRKVQCLIFLFQCCNYGILLYVGIIPAGNEMYWLFSHFDYKISSF